MNSDLDHILSCLSLEEKISLLSAEDFWRTPVIRRNGAPFVPHVKTTDGPNGARGESYVSGVKSACFQCMTCVGASFDHELAFEFGKQIALEAKAKSASILLAPTVNVIRSPLGGRNHEFFSEDPFVLGVMGAAYINGCQSAGVGATPKHFVANDVEKRRRTITANMTERTLREIYLYPFQLILKLSDPLCLMTSFNRVNGKYVADDHRLIQGVLRDEWKYGGLVMSDWNGTYSTAEAINAGVDLEMPGPTKFRGSKLQRAVNKDGTVEAETVTRSARRVLELVKRTGRFATPEEEPEKYAVNPLRDEFIAKSAAEGAVLLRNEGSILPIRIGDTSLKVVVIGQHAAVPTIMGGGSAKVDSARTISPLEGLTAAGVKFHYEPGVPIFAAIPLPPIDIISATCQQPSTSSRTIEPTKQMNSTAKPINLEFFNGLTVGKNPVHERCLEKTEYMLKERWPNYLSKDYCSRMTFNITPLTSGTHTFSVMTTGRAILYIDGVAVFTRDQDQHLQREAFYFFRSTFERRFTYPMTAGRTYSIILESWATTSKALAASIGGPTIQGSAVGFHEHVDIPTRIASAANAAAEADIAIIFTGTTAEFESEGYDRETMDLPCHQDELIAAVAQARPKNGTVMVNFSGAPVTMTSVLHRSRGENWHLNGESTGSPPVVDAILQCWFPGQECGHSVAALLTGRINPSGRLPMSWPAQIEDNPSYGNWPGDANDIIRYEEEVFVGHRHYDLPEKPNALFAFGFGLSYTKYEAKQIKLLGPREMHGKNGNIEIGCMVRNIGEREGKCTVQFYVQSPTCGDGELDTKRPLKELKAFKKVLVQAGESVEVRVTLDRYAVSYYYEAKSCWKALKGTYKVLVGFSSVEIVGEADFIISEDFDWNGL